MKIAMVFPGYGSQFVGMAKDLYDESRIMQEYFEEAYNCLNSNFIKLCFASSDNELSKPSNAYTSILLVSAALAKILEENSVKADVVAGYGIGQYCAMFTAGGITFPDALYLLKKLAQFYEEMLPHLDYEIIKINDVNALKLKKLIIDFESIQISCFNAQNENLISGKANEISMLCEILKSNKIKFKKIDKEFGLYNIVLSDLMNQFKLYMEKVDFKNISIPVLSCIDGKEILTSKKLKDYIVNQITKPIKWNKVIEKLKNYDLIIQVGPGNNLIENIKLQYPELKVVSFNSMDDLKEIKQIIQSNKEKIELEDSQIKNEEIHVQ